MTERTTHPGAIAVAGWWAARWNWGIIAKWRRPADPLVRQMAEGLATRLTGLLSEGAVRIDVSPIGEVSEVLLSAEIEALAGRGWKPGGFVSGWTLLYEDHAVAWSDRGRVLLWRGPGFNAQGRYGFCTSLPVPSLRTVRATRCSLPAFHSGQHVFTRPVSLCRVCGREVTACASDREGWHTCDPLPPGEDWEFMVPGWVPR